MGNAKSASVTRPILLTDINFDRPIAEYSELRDGWCETEEAFSWTVGKRASLVVALADRPAPRDSAYVLIIRGHPFIAGPALPRQRLFVDVNATQVAALTVDGLFAELVHIPRGVIRHGPVEIVFRHPDSDAPSSHGAADTRVLGIRFWQVRLFRLDRSAAAQARIPDEVRAMSNQFAALARLVPLTAAEQALCERLTATQDAITGAAFDLVFRKLFGECLAHGYILAASEMARRAAGTPHLALEYDGSVGGDFSVARFTKTAGGACVFGVSPALCATGVAHAAMIVWHLLAALPLFIRYGASDAPAGGCLVSLGDEGHAAGVAFCNKLSMDTLLIPDPYFVGRNAYAGLRGPENAATPWHRRRPLALWRGSTTGYSTSPNILDLPRAKLCLLAARPENAAYLDAGFTGLTQDWPAAARNMLLHLGLMREFVPPERFQEWKYVIDIDGNTNAWPGLFEKLLSGAVVLKVESGSAWRQWYYDRLRDGENYVAVKNDMSDLVEKICLLHANDEMARAIGARGRELALSLEYHREIQSAQRSLATAILIEER